MAKLDNLEEKLDKVNILANEVSKKANNEISILKHKITCLTILVGLLLIIGASISIYSIHSMKELFYSIETEETTEYSQDIDTGDNGNAIGIIRNNNEVDN